MYMLSISKIVQRFFTFSFFGSVGDQTHGLKYIWPVIWGAWHHQPPNYFLIIFHLSAVDPCYSNQRLSISSITWKSQSLRLTRATVTTTTCSIPHSLLTKQVDTLPIKWWGQYPHCLNPRQNFKTASVKRIWQRWYYVTFEATLKSAMRFHLALLGYLVEPSHRTVRKPGIQMGR
jgi:hypothetical protein